MNFKKPAIFKKNCFVPLRQPQDAVSHSRIFAILFFLLIAVLGIFFAVSSSLQNRSLSADEAFQDFTKELFLSGISSSTLTLHYTLADPAAAGIEDPPVTFGEYSADTKAERAAVLENTLKTLETFPRDELSASNRLTFDILRTQLQNELKLSAYPYYEEILSPLLGVQAQLPTLLAEYRFTCRKDIDTYLDLLGELGSYFDSLLLFEQEKAQNGLFMSTQTAEAVIDQCREFIAGPEEHFLLSSFEERLEQTDFLTASEKKAYLETNRVRVIGTVLPAYEALTAGLEKLKDSGTNPYGLCYYEEGADYYEALVECTTGSGRSMKEIKELIDAQILTDTQLMANIVTRNPQLLTSLSRSVEKREPQQILRELREQIREEFPAVPSVSCTVKYVPSSLESYVSPAFYLTPPLDSMDEQIIYINPSSDYDDLALFATLAHEGWPGHLYQTLYENSMNFDPVRSIFYFGGYTEGWAVYAERYAYRFTSLDEDTASLLAANSFLLLGLYARSDIGIHYDGWKPADLAEFLGGFGIRSQTALDTIYQAIVQNPGNYLKYYLGAAEILDLKAEAEKAFGEQFDIRDFHRFILSVGPAPLSVVREYLYGWTGTD